MEEKRERAIKKLLGGHVSSAGGTRCERCPDENEMAAFLEKRLSREEGTAIEMHLAECARCRREAAALARSFEAEAVPLPAGGREISFVGLLEGTLAAFRRPAVALSAACALLLMALVAAGLWRSSKPEALLAKADSLLQRGETERAGAICERLLASEKLPAGFDARARRTLGLAFHKGALKERVTGSARKTTDPFPSAFAVVLFTRSGGEIPEPPPLPGESLRGAFVRYGEALEIAPGDAESMRLLASAHDDAGDRERAKALYERALGTEPRNPDLLNDYGVLLLREGREEEALDIFKKTLELDGDHLPALYNAARLQERAGRGEDAAELWLRYLELDTESPWAAIATRRLRGAEGEQ